jgi:hypothetical protein
MSVDADTLILFAVGGLGGMSPGGRLSSGADGRTGTILP